MTDDLSVGNAVEMRRWRNWLRWKPATYPQVVVYSVVFGVLVALISWVTHPNDGGRAIIVGAVLGGVMLAVRSMRIWDRRSSDDR